MVRILFVLLCIVVGSKYIFELEITKGYVF